MQFLARRLVAPSWVYFYKTLSVVAIGGMGLLYIYNNDPSDPRMLSCPIYEHLQLYCPGCGTTRALYQLLHGNLLAAFRYNSLMLVSIPLLMYMSIAQLLNEIWGWQLPRVFRTSTDINIVLSIILIYTVLRNIPLFPFALLAPTML